MDGRPRVWPARVLLAAWVALLAVMLVADPSWVPAMLLAATAAAVAVPAVLGALSGARLQARISTPGQVPKGAAADCTLSVANESALPVWRVRVPVIVGNPVTGEQTTLSLDAALPPHGTASVPFHVQSSRCGSLSVRCECAWPVDPLGIVRRRRALAAQSRIAVPPLADPMAVRRSGARAHDMESFTYAADRAGDDPAETYDMREYQPGDSVRRIHWKLSGKLRTTMLRESGFPIYSSLLLLVETGWDEGGPVPAAADAQMEAASSLMASLMQDGVAFDLAFFDRSSGSLVLRHVGDDAAMWDAIALLLAAPREAAPEGSIRAFLEYAGGTVWGRCVYLTAGHVGADAALLGPSCGTLTVLRCAVAERAGDAAALSATGGEPVRRDGYDESVFAPDRWQADLAGVVL